MIKKSCHVTFLSTTKPADTNGASELAWPEIYCPQHQAMTAVVERPVYKEIISLDIKIASEGAGTNDPRSSRTWPQRDLKPVMCL